MKMTDQYAGHEHNARRAISGHEEARQCWMQNLYSLDPVAVQLAKI